MKTTVTRLPRGFSLVEVTLALGVAAFCLVALFGLLPIGVNSNQTSLEQTGAASVAAGVVADLRSTLVAAATVSASASPSSSPAPSSSPPLSKQYGIPVLPTTSSATTNANGTTTTTPTFTLFVRDDGSMAQDLTSSTVTNTSTGWDIDRKRNPHYRVTLIFTPPAANQLSATMVRVLVTWPAEADPKAISSTATDPLKDANFPSKFSGSFEAVTALDRS